VNYELIVGLEIHAQLITETKAFCRCPNRYGDPPNTLICPTCLGMPGTLPVLNEAIVRQAARLALSLGATIHPRCKFDRKNYFYPDLPKGYQISQYDEPFSTDGFLTIECNGSFKDIRITRAHIEEDAGKSMHQPDGSTVVDMNRCGVPLVEIVTEPDFRTPEEAGAFVSAIRELLRYVEVCDGNMERGSLRCDVNISVRPAGQAALNERSEIKNLNSIRAVEKAIRSEKERQIAVYASGGAIQRETLLWDEAVEELRPMRRKEGSDDYRYFPEPDLVELCVSPEYVENVRNELPEFPWERRRRYRKDLELHEEAVSLLASDRELGDYFEKLLTLGVEPRSAANWMQGEVRRHLTDQNLTIGQFPVSPQDLTELIQFVQQDAVSLTQAKDVFRKMLAKKCSARDIIRDEGMMQSQNAGEIESVIRSLLQKHPHEVERYRSGKKNVMGFFMGEAMKATGGKANPKMLSRLLEDMLKA